MLIDSMVASGQLDESLRQKVREAMLKKHHHQNERKLSNRIPLVRSIADIGKKHSDPHLLECNGEAPTPFYTPPFSSLPKEKNKNEKKKVPPQLPSSPIVLLSMGLELPDKFGHFE